MKKQLLTLLLVMAGMVSWAQSGSGWTNPGNAYQQQTVVYAILNFGNGISGDIAPEVAAFIDGEVRAVTSNPQMNDIGNIYTMRIGGEDADIDKAVQFKVYDPATGLIYPLEVTDETGAPSEVTYQGDYTYREQDETTGGYRVIRFNLSATPVEGITVKYASEDNPVVPLKVGEETTIEDYVTFEFQTASGAEPTIPENPLVWNLDREDNFGNPTSYYLNIETNSDGFNIATGLNKTNGYPVTAGVVIGDGYLGADVDFIVTQPVTSIEVADAEIYLGVGRFVPQPRFNGGESEPSNTGFTLSVETEDVVRAVGQAIIPQALGTAVVTATSEENPEITTTFRVTVISALESMDVVLDTDAYEYTRNSDGEEIIELPDPTFKWIVGADGKPVISNIPSGFETFTIESSDPTVIRIDEQVTDNGTEILPMSLKKGTAQITYTSNYDPSKSVTFTVVVKQGVQEIAITEVNGVEIVGMDQTVDVTVGETIVARAKVAPLDADYEEFTMQFVNANWGIIENIEDYVEIIKSEVVDGICTFEFKFIKVPETEYYLQAVIDNDFISSIVGINVYDVVKSIEVYMNEEYWITEDENIFDFKYIVNPSNVLDPSITVVSSNPDVAEVLMSEDAGYRLYAYAPGEVTFTFTSVSNPDVAVEYYTVIKREPTGVAITKVGSVDVPAPGAPSETVVDIAVGQDVVAVAGIEPNDATYDSFEFELVDNDGIPFEDEVTIGDRINNGDGTISLGFTFNSVPDRDVNLKAVARYTQYGDEVTLEHRIRLNVKQGVTSVELYETEKTIWWTYGEETHFAISATVNPEDATDKTLEVSIDGEGVVELVGESEEVENGYRFIVKGKGTATITFTSVDNPSVSATCTVTVKKRVTEMSFEGNIYNMYNDGEVHHGTLTFYPEDADFVPEMLNVNVDSPGMPEDWTALDLIILGEGENYIDYEVVPRALGSGSIEFSYCNPEDEEAMSCFADYSVQEKITVEAGWNWFSLINGEVNIAETLYDMLIEARSQDELVFNDASWGLFGDLINMDNTQAYKLNIHEDYGFSEIYLRSEANVEGKIHTKSLKKGWNWVSYPYEFGYDVATIFDASMFSENDMILSKNDGFVQRNADGEWEGGLSELVPYQGYMVYCNADIELVMPGRYDLPQGYFANLNIPRAASRERATWVYDNSRFANSMAIVAKVDVENCEDYTIGAFVGDECRGEGKFINGKAFISVGGESGENISFRLLNKWTGELLDVAQEIPFGDMAGSIKAPVLMGTIDGTTGIVDINTIDNNNVEAIYDITGRKVEQMTEGIYVIKVREGDKIVTKKVRK